MPLSDKRDDAHNNDNGQRHVGRDAISGSHFGEPFRETKVALVPPDEGRWKVWDVCHVGGRLPGLHAWLSRGPSEHDLRDKELGEG